MTLVKLENNYIKSSWPRALALVGLVMAAGLVAYKLCDRAFEWRYLRQYR